MCFVDSLCSIEILYEYDWQYLTGEKCKTDIQDMKAGNSCDTSEANPLQIVERPDNTTGKIDNFIICFSS